MADRFSIEGLRHAHAVAKAASFGAAARASGVSQPALSNAIANLEDRLGGRLFERSPQGVAPTAFGHRLLPLIERALADIDAISAEARRANRPGGIRVGVSPLIAPELVARAFRAARELPEPRDLVLSEANMRDLREQLTQGDLDMILVPSVGPMPGYEHTIVDAEPVVIVAAEAGDARPLDLREAAATGELILVPDSCGLTTFTTQLFDARGLPVRTYPGEASSYQVLEQWASLGLGVALVPRSKLSSADAVHHRLTDDGLDVEIFYAGIWHPGSALAAELAALTSALVTFKA